MSKTEPIFLEWFIAHKIKAARKGRGLTQEALAGRLKVVRTTIALWETARRTPDIEMLYRISLALDVPVTVFLPPPVKMVLKSVTDAIVDVLDDSLQKLDEFAEGD